MKQGSLWRFTGRQFDAETGLYYYRARMYNAALGRFMQTDPAGDVDSLNLYQYALWDPIVNKDPTGKCVGPALAICAGAAAGYTVSVAKQVYFDKKSFGEALFSKESGASLLAGGFVGAGIMVGGLQATAIGFSALSGEIVGAVAVSPSAALISTAIESNRSPTNLELAATTAGNLVGLGMGKLVGAGVDPATKVIAEGVSDAASVGLISQRTAGIVAAGTVAIGTAAKEGLSEIASQATQDGISGSGPPPGQFHCLTPDKCFD